MSWRGLNWDGPGPPVVPTPAEPDQRLRNTSYDYIVVPEGPHRGLYMPPLPGFNGEAERILEIMVGAAHTRQLPLVPCDRRDDKWSFALGLVIVGLGERRFL